MKLFLKGERCYTSKCAIERRKYAPGQHGQKQRKLEEFRIQLREKQKLKRIYRLMERQFRNYFDEAVRSTAGRRTPAWLTVHPEEFRGQVLSVPSRDQIDTQVEEQLIVEYYSNR